MQLLRILFVFGFISPACFAMEIQPQILPRNLKIYCKVCDSVHNIFDNFSYEDYDYWRTIDIQDKIKLFCSICKKKTESTTVPTTTTGSETTITPSTSTTRQSETPETTSTRTTTSTSETPVTTSTPVSTPSSSETTTSTPTTTPSTTTI